MEFGPITHNSMPSSALHDLVAGAQSESGMLWPCSMQMCHPQSLANHEIMKFMFLAFLFSSECTAVLTAHDYSKL